ncbi:uncharacterized protein LOC106666415 isoform X1 [Cimex lectularius]|uniref:Uncharacterized protein n=1 Tax=Cimex lectularius TaxID=79782 RepID=A0A8I6RSZ6_CIMLE|nr:uncharacterized protein LOC106666415 isoform X1 [Cimex lectularius]
MSKQESSSLINRQTGKQTPVVTNIALPLYPIDHVDGASKNRNPFNVIPVYDYHSYMDRLLNDPDGTKEDYANSRRRRTESSFPSSSDDDNESLESFDEDEDDDEKPSTPQSKLIELASIIGVDVVPDKSTPYQNKFTFAPKTRRKRWPGVELPKQGTRRLNKNQTLRHRILTIWNVAYAIRKKIEEIEIAEADVDIEPEPYKEEPETEEEEENLAHELRKMKNLWWKMGRDEDLPVDVQLADRYVRASPKLSENSPVHIQREMQQCKEFQDYLDNHGVSELIIGILMMLYTKPCYPEGAKELLRLGLGGKPTEVATAADVLKEIEEAQDRISDLEGELYDYRVQVLRLLKEDAYDEPDDPTVSKTPIRRMEYLLKAFQCRSRPSDVDFNMLYDLSELPGLAKYKIKLPKELDALGRGLAVGSSMGKAEIGVNTKKWILGPPMDHSTELH